MKKFKNLFFVVSLTVVAFFFQMYSTNLSENITSIYAAGYNPTYTTKNYEDINLSNQNFNNRPSVATLDEEPTGWNKVLSGSTATSGVIYVNQDDNKFATYYDKYQLDATGNPGKAENSLDNKVLMINATNGNGVESQNSQGYKSSDIELSAYSYYEISVLAYTTNTARASIYVNGLEDYADNLNSYFNVTAINDIQTNQTWQEYKIFIATDFEAPTISLSLYLGSSKEVGSTGVVFFDNITVKQAAEFRFAEDLNATSDNEPLLIAFKNFIKESNDFENGVTDYELIGSLEQGTYANTLNMLDSSIASSLEIPFLGLDKSMQNNNALVLHSASKTYVGYETTDISIDQFGMYKISINVKVSDIVGNVNIKLIENNDVNEFYGDDFDAYEPISETISISSTDGGELMNGYVTASFYVKAHPLYDSSIKLQLTLGNEENNASGTVAFDNLKVIELTNKQFEAISTSSNEKKVTLTTVTGTPSITNGYFNSGAISDLENKFPLTPDSWTQTENEENSNNFFGILNTNDQKWASYNLGLGNDIDNPAIQIGGTLNGTLVKTPTTDTNNILTVVNKTQSYQTIKSPEIKLEADKFYNLTFNYLAINQISDATSILNIYLYDSNDRVIYEDLDVKSSSWDLYSIKVKTQYYATSAYFVFEVGTQDSKAKGYVYFDNFELNTLDIDDEEFDSYVENNTALDLSNLGLAVKGDTLVAGTNLHDPLMFSESLDTSVPYDKISDIAAGGINDENQFVIMTHGKGTYKLTSLNSIELKSDSYYKFTIKISTEFAGDVTNLTNTDFGAIFALDGIDEAKIKNITSVSGDTYEIHIYASEAQNVKIIFGFTSDTFATTGNAYFEEFTFEKSDKDTYTAAQTDSETNKHILAFSATALPEDDEEDEDTEETAAPNVWILISTIVMTLAFFIAIIGWALRKIEIKKIRKKKETTYNRNSTLARETIIREAEKRRDEEVKVLEGHKAELEEYLKGLEDSNKDKLQTSRHEAITRKKEKEFKAYAKKRNKIMRDIQLVQDKINEVNSPEHLMKLERIISNETTNDNKSSK